MPGRRFARSIGLAAVVLLLLAVSALPAPAETQAPGDDGIARLLKQIEQAVASDTPDAYVKLFAPDVESASAREMASGIFVAGVTRAAVHELDRLCAPTSCIVIADVFRERGNAGILSTWRLDVRRLPGQGAETWSIVGQSVLNTVNGLYRLSLNPSRIYSAQGVALEAEDFSVTMTEGSVFVAEAGDRPTGFVLVGKGQMRFTPAPAAERGQMKIFAGAEQLQTPVEALFVRVNPGEVDQRIKGLREARADARDERRAAEVFHENNGRSYCLDLTDLSPDTWSLVPREGDFLAEVYTRRYGVLTYGVAPTDAEDIVLFDRKAHKSIAQYASRARLASRGPYYDENENADYEVVDYDVDARFSPESNLLDAKVRMTVRVRAESLTHLSVRLADTLVVRSIQAEGIGRVLPLRVRGRNTVLVTLPVVATRGAQLVLNFDYGGTVAPQRLEDAPVADPDAQESQEAARVEPSFLYSSRPYWYPQGMVETHATATMRLTVPARFSVVASGQPVGGLASGAAAGVASAGEGGWPGVAHDEPVRTVTFEASHPLRYLACVITPLVQAKTEHLRLSDAARRLGVAGGDAVDILVQTSPREKALGRDMTALVADIARFFSELTGDFPYSTLNVAMLEHKLPGGHSPAYLAIVNYVSPRSGLAWNGDPASIDGFPEYFVAHEVAHQWWGQAIGIKNYHEQWLSEGFAQYFAALYAEHAHGRELFQDILRGWQKWTVDKSDQGPVYLGYRVGHIKSDSRVFRAVVYNKGAMVLHMLRRLLGDDAFFRGLRRFYRANRFSRAGTEDLRRALEAEGRVGLQRFFDVWIYGDTLPRLRAATRVETAAGGAELVVDLEQAGTVFDLPLTVTLDYANRPPAEVTVRLEQARQEFRIPLAGPLRRADLNRAHVVPFLDFTVGASPLPATAARSLRAR